MEFRMIQLPEANLMARIPRAPSTLWDDTCSGIDAQNGGRHRRAAPALGFVKGQFRDGSQTLYAPQSLTAL
jgi:hypothetical protein